MSDDTRAGERPESLTVGSAASNGDQAAGADGSPETGSAIGASIGWVFRQKPVRVFFHYLTSRGPLMASGLAYQAVFAVFAALWLTFSIAGFVISQNVALRDTLIAAAASAVPGLIRTGGQDGLVDPGELLGASVLGWSGTIALVALLAAVLGWLDSAREAVRAMFGLPVTVANLLLLKLKDLGLALVFGAALLVSSALSALSTRLLGSALDFLGFDRSWVTTVLGTLVGLLVVLALDTTVLAALFRVLSSVTVPVKRLFGGALIGGVAVGVLKVGGTALLGGATSRNPLLNSFGVGIGLLIWFNLVCQAVLVCSAWIAVGMTDHGIAPDPKAEAERLEVERVRREQEDAVREAEVQRRAAVLAARLEAREGAGRTEHDSDAGPLLSLVRRTGGRAAAWWHRRRRDRDVGGRS